ncbi:Trm112 family protein [Basilea psittacipulmonis]|uniref:Trm112 family protein n=1 Tax=Basilea psittacipulmonis TaxID=1472345 RepID=UPI000B2EB936|nr:Trm112 family protein [Basilea psittacipulmonis]
MNQIFKKLICPVTHETLQYDEQNKELISLGAKLAYPIKDGIPILIPEKARKLD